MFSLEDYVAKYVKGRGPINILQIDGEGYDFDVLFGAGSVLDSTHYLEIFEYRYRLPDAVRLLDGKAHAKVNLKMTCIDNLSLDLQLSHEAPTHSSEAAGLTFQKISVTTSSLVNSKLQPAPALSYF
eukprot:scaffold9675_cov143-Skeletonema_marinoi.AAC.5